MPVRCINRPIGDILFLTYFCLITNLGEFEHEFSAEFEGYVKNNSVGSGQFLSLLQVTKQDAVELEDLPNALSVSEIPC